ncbi:MAG: hypothetical protein H0U74_00775 [Bradymonadaceae bacterium]|nr:hypothetical protein [Lujinxingiaceae bacterium]
MKSTAWKKNLIVGAKLTLCGASIAAIAWAVGVFDFKGEVASSHADIGWFSTAPRTNTALFMDSLDRLGHEKPRMFDLNGNLTYFSTRSSDREPVEILREYQDEFKRQGLNDRAFYGIDQSEQMLVTALTGGVIPIAISDNTIAMGGMVTKNKAKTQEALRENFEDEKNPHKVFRGHRYIEINREPGTRFSSITATWSNEEFDYGKMVAGNAIEGQNTDVNVPACPGCTRLQRFVDLDRSKDFESNVYMAPNNLSDTRDFYRQAMSGRGWEPTEASQAMVEARAFVDFPGDEADIIQFARGQEFLTLMFYPDTNGETTVYTVKTN